MRFGGSLYGETPDLLLETDYWAVMAAIAENSTAYI